jgi:hypothetical protein
MNSVKAGRGDRRTRPDLPAFETSSRPPGAGLEGTDALLFSPDALPPAGRLVWRSAVGSTSRGVHASRRSTAGSSSTPRSCCGYAFALRSAARGASAGGRAGATGVLEVRPLGLRPPEQDRAPPARAVLRVPEQGEGWGGGPRPRLSRSGRASNYLQITGAYARTRCSVVIKC